MYELKDKAVLVVGLGAGGEAACELLRRRGANVLAIDSADTADLRSRQGRLQPLGVRVQLGVKLPPKQRFNLAVLSPAEARNPRLLQELTRREVPVIGELELGYQQARCLNLAIAGTNGKTTAACLIERLLARDHRRTLLAGVADRHVCSAVEQSRELDFLILRVSALQLEATQYFRPAVAVLTNLAPDHLDVYGSSENYARACARLFQNQQPFDWAIIQSEALATLRSLGIPVTSKIITFSANPQWREKADLFLDRSLLISGIEGWSGPLLDLDQCRLRGPHNAENLMAALAVGKVLRTPLEAMTTAIRDVAAPAHCCERMGERGGVTFFDDAKCANVDALQKALLTVPAVQADAPNVWLIAGGRDRGQAFHDAGPVLSRRVKGALLIGEASEKIRAAWSLFTPCTVHGSLLEAVQAAARHAVAGDVVLLSPACSSFDQFRDYRHRGEVYRQAVENLPDTPGDDEPRTL